MLTRNLIRVSEETSNRQKKAIHETYAGWERDKNPDTYQAWSDACREYHQTTLPTDYLWSPETRQSIREGNREAIDDALLLLEVDPWYDCSGYLREWLLENLRQAPLTDDDRARLRRIIVNVAGGKNRREFKRYCSLAVKVTTDEFERELEELAKEHDAESSGKYSYLLGYIREHRHDY